MQRQVLSLLMVTPTDYVEMWNNVEHGRVRFYREQGVPMTVVHLRLNRSSRFIDLLRDTLTFRTRQDDADGARFIAVDPFFNYCAGMRVHSDAQVKAEGGRRSIRHLIVRAFAPLAVLRDVFFAPCFVAAAIWKAPGIFDACLGIGPWASLVGLTLRKLGKVKVLVYEDRDYEPGLMPDRLRQWYTGIVERFVQSRADLVISVGYRLAALRRDQSGVDPVVISNGIEWDRFENARRVSASSRTMLYVGNLCSWSGLEQNLRAMPKLLLNVPDARMLIVGSGHSEYERFLRQLVRELRLDHAVEFAGSQPHVRLPEFMSRAAMGLANSQPVAYRQYACPLKVIEYMAAGLPTIATEDTEAADMIRRYDCGLVSDFEVEAISEAMRIMLTNRTLQDRFRSNALRESRILDWRHLLARERQLIEALIE